MGVTEIPRSFRYECDGCGAYHVQENAGGHYTDSRPPGWAHVKVNAFGEGWPSDRSSSSLLCGTCSGTILDVISDALAARAGRRRGSEV